MCLSECELISDLVRLVDQFDGGQPTVMTWNMACDIALPSVENGDYDFIVDWGDGTPVQRNIFEHKFGTSKLGEYRVTITGKFHGLSFYKKTGRERLTSIAWGSKVKLVPAQGRHFQECYRLETFTGIPNIIGVTDMSKMFYGCKQFNGELSKWDTSNVTDMELMFEDCKSFNGDLSNWNTSNVHNMSKMFGGCNEFNGDLSKWDTSDVTNMSRMFLGCINFNGDLSNWDTSKVQNMRGGVYLVSQVQRGPLQLEDKQRDRYEVDVWVLWKVQRGPLQVGYFLCYRYVLDVLWLQIVQRGFEQLGYFQRPTYVHRHVRVQNDHT